jgi:very-short-patch-repair endonuclease
MDLPLSGLLDSQEGVVARPQVLALAGGTKELRRLLRRERLIPLQRGVYVNHTGEATWRQRVWAAYLSCPGAALAGRTALAWMKAVPEPRTLELAVEHGRRVTPPVGALVRQVDGLERRCKLEVEPRMLRFEEALIDVAAGAHRRDSGLVLIMDSIQQRRTTVARLRSTLESRSRVAHRAWLMAALDDVETGSFSLLERGYVARVERPHGLPNSKRQVRSVDVRARYRDLEYVDQRVIVELDGMAGHTATADRRADMDRDLHAAAQGRTTIRLTWRHVEGDPCRTAALVARALRSHGWRGAVARCGPSCRAKQ